MNSLYNDLKPKQQANPMQLMNQFRQDPVGILQQVGYKIPDGLTNPQQILSHLMSSGQVMPNKIQQLRQMIGK